MIALPIDITLQVAGTILFASGIAIGFGIGLVLGIIGGRRLK